MRKLYCTNALSITRRQIVAGFCCHSLTTTTTTTTTRTAKHRISQKRLFNTMIDNENAVVRTSSPVETYTVRGYEIYMKRDDYLSLPGSGLSGNKARKLYELDQIPSQDFPQIVISAGGPQSNAMASLASVVMKHNNTHMKMMNRSYRMIYYTKDIPKEVKENPSGNLLQAIKLGVEIIELPRDIYNRDFKEIDKKPSKKYIDQIIKSNTNINDDDILWIPMGGFQKSAEKGCINLANEIKEFWYNNHNNNQNNNNNNNNEILNVVLPSGTGTTAFFLAKHLMNNNDHHNTTTTATTTTTTNNNKRQEKLFNVITVPCYGDDIYLLNLMNSLQNHENENKNTNKNENKERIKTKTINVNTCTYTLPKVLSPIIDNYKYRFAKPSKQLADIYLEMKNVYGIELDLLYGPRTWEILFQHYWQQQEEEDNDKDKEKTNNMINNRNGDKIYSNKHKNNNRKNRKQHFMYIHTGGLEGLDTQVKRYQKKGFLL